jgi:hypothetical protein
MLDFATHIHQEVIRKKHVKWSHHTKF